MLLRVGRKNTEQSVGDAALFTNSVACRSASLKIACRDYSIAGPALVWSSVTCEKENLAFFDNLTVELLDVLVYNLDIVIITQ